MGRAEHRNQLGERLLRWLSLQLYRLLSPNLSRPQRCQNQTAAFVAHTKQSPKALHMFAHSSTKPQIPKKDKISLQSINQSRGKVPEQFGPVFTRDNMPASQDCPSCSFSLQMKPSARSLHRICTSPKIDNPLFIQNLRPSIPQLFAACRS